MHFQIDQEQFNRHLQQNDSMSLGRLIREVDRSEVLKFPPELGNDGFELLVSAVKLKPTTVFIMHLSQCIPTYYTPQETLMKQTKKERLETNVKNTARNIKKSNYEKLQGLELRFE